MLNVLDEIYLDDDEDLDRLGMDLDFPNDLEFDCMFRDALH